MAEIESKVEKSILLQNNSRLGSYTFSTVSGEQNKGKYFCNDFTGLPSIPLIGKYGKFGYETNTVALISVAECLCIDGAIIAQETGESILIPEYVKDILFNIPHKIEIHRNPEAKKNNNNTQKGPNKGKQQKQAKDSQDELEFDLFGPDKNAIEEERKADDKVNNKNKKNNNAAKNEKYDKEFNPIEYLKASRINFLWSVSFQGKEVFANKEGMSIMNLVLHPLVFETISFDKTKRDFKSVPVCIFPISGIEESDDSPRAVNFEFLRSEYLSVHLKGPSLCFSPNNMKFLMDNTLPISHFFSLVLKEDGMHYLTYHWNVNDQVLQETLQDLFTNQKNLSDILNFLPSIVDSQAVAQLIEIFGPSLTKCNSSEEIKKCNSKQSEDIEK